MTTAQKIPSLELGQREIPQNFGRKSRKADQRHRGENVHHLPVGFQPGKKANNHELRKSGNLFGIKDRYGKI